MTPLAFSDRSSYDPSGLDGFSVVDADLKPQAAVFRVLAGTCVIHNVITGREIEADVNYFIHYRERNESCSLRFLDSYQEGLTSVDYDRQLKEQIFVNRKFYRSVLDEVAVCVASVTQGRHVDAFLHLYRCYERIAYAFPMVYAAKNLDYLGSFDSLRKWLTSSNKDQLSGELAFFKKFLLSTYGEDELAATIDFDVVGPSAARQVIFETIATRLLGWTEASHYAGDTTYPDKLSVPFSKAHEVLLTARNRYFHQSSGRLDNFGQKDVADPELFFSTLTGPLLGYLATLFHDIFVSDMSRVTG